MRSTPSPQLRGTQRPRAAWLLFIAIALAIAMALHGPVAQWAGYHAFADARAWWGLPNALNVLSNLPFALIGGWGLWLHSQAHRTPAATNRAWWYFSAALCCTALGSAFYHWAPANASLVFDRLPIAWACAALLCAFLGERIDTRWAGAPALATGLVIATGSVLWWWFTEQQGQGDLRAYLYVQFLPMLLVPAAIWLGLPALDARAVRYGAWWAVLGLYAAAKGVELADPMIFDALGFTSGHTLKHLLAAAAAFVLLRGTLRQGAPGHARPGTAQPQLR